MVALPAAAIYWRPKPEVGDDPYAATDWTLATGLDFDPTPGQTVQVCSVWPSRIAEAVAQTPLIVLELSDEDSALRIDGFSPDAERVILTVLAPSPYAGTYEADLATLAAGSPVCLRVPEITVGTGNALTAQPALWVYDPAVYAANSAVFALGYAWVTDTGTVLAVEGLSFTRSTYRAVRFREIAEGATGLQVTVHSATLPAITVPATVIASGAPRPVSLASIFPTGLRAFSFACAVSPSLYATTQRLLSRDVGATSNLPGVQITTGGNLTVTSGGTGITNLTLTGASGASTVGRPRVSIAASVDLDRYGEAANRAMSWVQNGVLTGGDVLRVGADATAHAAGLVNNPLGAFFARLNTFAEPFVGTAHAWVWLHDAAIKADKLGAALFEAVPTTVDPTGWAPRLLPQNGAIVVDGVTIVPKVFITGDNFGQEETSPGSGVWQVPNRGSLGGFLPLTNGAFA